MPEELRQIPPMPEEISFLWRVFQDLNWGRPRLMGAQLPIPHMEILAWCALHGERLRPWEIQVLRALDAAWLRAVNKPDETPQA